MSGQSITFEQAHKAFFFHSGVYCDINLQNETVPCQETVCYSGLPTCFTLQVSIYVLLVLWSKTARSFCPVKSGERDSNETLKPAVHMCMINIFTPSVNQCTSSPVW